MSFARSANLYLQKIFGRLSTQLERGCSLHLLADEARAYRRGPIDLLMYCADALPYAPMSRFERLELDSRMHDTVRADVVACGYLPSVLRRGKLEVVHDVLRGAANSIFNKFLSSSVSPEVLSAHAHDVKVLVRVPGEEMYLRAGLPTAELALALRELVRNGVKYRDPTKLEQTVRIVWDESTSTLQIIDNGIGIRDTEKIWDWGYREHRNDAPGTGFGLHGVKRRLESMGWSIRVISVVGEGTTFVITPQPGDVYVPVE